MKQLFFLSFLVLSAAVARSQDMIYTTSGNKFQAKVVEITSNEVKYKDFSNLDGPTYVITKQDVVLISYQNGTTEVVNPNPPSYSPNKANTDYATKKPEHKNPNELYYTGKNMLSINALALANGDLALFYDRDLLNDKLGITAMGSYNFNDRINQVLNIFVDNLYPNSKKMFDAGLGANFFPSNRGRAQYFVGLMGKYMQFTYDKETTVEQDINGFVFLKKSVERSTGSQTMFGVTNGLLVRVSPTFNFKLFATVGTSVNSPAVEAKSGSYPKVYLGYCFGYRF